MVALCVAASACGRIGYDAREAGRSDGALDATGNLDSSSESDGGTSVDDVAPDRREREDARPMLDGEPMMCPMGTVQCGRDCADFQRDARHCGDCGTVCAVGQVCRMGSCATVARAPAGTSCTESDECGAGPNGPGFCLSGAAGWTGGYCSSFCRASAECAMNEVCLNEESAHVALPLGISGICLKRCTMPGQQAECESGQLCATRGADAVCVASCQATLSPCSGNACNLITGACVACADSSQCMGNGACNMGRCSCTAMTDCGLWSVCYPATGRCGCERDLFCPLGMRCNTATGDCFRP